MQSSRQFQILHGRDDFTPDQLNAITAEVKKRQHILNFAVKNLEQALHHMQTPAQMNISVRVTTSKNRPKKKLIKKPSVPAKTEKPIKAVKGQVSYKVKGPGGKLMDISEIKRWVDSFYDGEQGIVKQ